MGDIGAGKPPSLGDDPNGRLFNAAFVQAFHIFAQQFFWKVYKAAFSVQADQINIAPVSLVQDNRQIRRRAVDIRHCRDIVQIERLHDLWRVNCQHRNCIALISICQ